MILGVCSKPNAEPIPTQLVYARFPLDFFNLLQITGGLMLTVLAVLAFFAALAMGSLPLLGIAIIGLAFKIYPIVALLVIAAATAWAINHFWR